MSARDRLYWLGVVILAIAGTYVLWHVTMIGRNILAAIVGYALARMTR